VSSRDQNRDAPRSSPARPEDPQVVQAGGEADIPLPVAAQILISLKSNDPTALTAQEAIRHLLGFGDGLVEIRRRHLHELVLQPANESAPLSSRLLEYLRQTFVFWNPNKQRAWVRSSSAPFTPAARPGAEGSSAGQAADSPGAGHPWEMLAGQARAGDFGAPDLQDPAYDHVLLWTRGQGGAPADLAPALAPWKVLAYGRGELYSLRWRPESSAAERRGWTESVAVARSSREGLLVNPHFQDHRVFSGAVPLPLWSGF